MEYNPRFTTKTVKHGGAKVMVWGSFSYGAVGPIYLIEGIMDQKVYVRILEEFMIPHATWNMPLKWIFQQDNDPKHTSKSAKEWFRINGIELMRWPAQSPDLNLIENLWTDIKKCVDQQKPTNSKDLRKVVKEAWEGIPIKRFQDLIDSMPRTERLFRQSFLLFTARNIQLSPTKSTAFLIATWTKEVKLHLKVKVDDTLMQTVNNPKVLDVTFDSLLYCLAHTSAIATTIHNKALESPADNTWAKDKEMLLVTFKSIKDVTRNIKKAVVAGTLEELRSKVAEKFEHVDDQLPTIHLDSDGTEIDDEEYFRTLDENTELIAVFPGEHWIDPTHYVTITSHRGSNSGIVGGGGNGVGVGGGGGVEQPGDTTDAAAETARIKQLVGQLQNNLCNVSVLSDPDLDSLSNMDPNSLVDITGKDFMEQLKDSGRPLCAKRNAEDRINLLKLLREGAIFCSERYPEDAEAIDMEISRQLNMDVAQTTTTITTNTNTTTTITANTTTVNIGGVLTSQQQQQQTITTNKTIEQVQSVAAAAVAAAAAAQRIAAMEAQMTSVDVVTIVETHAAATANTHNNNQQKTMTAGGNNNNKTNDI
ncbi:uncharacterized protein LOC129244272 [Anastrepha obliqua]|uniref:uncharacterized protein LOC129244272 n=1 Tax=Anastrepha obliqua TaxID=95512 RepID=UPI0024098B0A|nr:uncharacterized protein LOC129244272 [Anastrepha obliqua]